MSINWFSSDQELEGASHQNRIGITVVLLVFLYISATIHIIFLFSRGGVIALSLISPFLE